MHSFPEGEPEHKKMDMLLGLARLSHCRKPADFRTLDCLGFLPPKPGTSGYGFVYAFPEDECSTAPMTAMSLRRFLENNKLVVTLGEKFGGDRCQREYGDTIGGGRVAEGSAG